MIFFRNAVKPRTVLYPFACPQRAWPYTGGRRVLSNNSLDQTEAVDKAIREADRVKLLTSNKLLSFDLWGRPLELLDLRVPVPVFTRGTTLQKIWSSVDHNLKNTISNAVAMHRIAQNHSFPWDPTLKPYSYQIFRTKSTRSNTWLEPLRDIGLDSYKQLNTAIAKGQTSVIDRLTKGSYRRRALERMKMLHKNSQSLNWTLHSLASPVQCVSIRGFQGHYGSEAPKFGTQWFIQACLKFDSWQSLSVRAATVQPEPKRVLEYLVFEKRMWYDEPWAFRDQLWEAILSKDPDQT